MDGVDVRPPPLSASPTSHVTMQGQMDQDSGEGQISANSVPAGSEALSPSPSDNNCQVEPFTETQDETESNQVAVENDQCMNDEAAGKSPSNSDTTENVGDEPDSNCGQENMNEIPDMANSLNLETEQSEDLSNPCATLDNTSQPSDLSMRDHCHASPENTRMPDREVGTACTNETQISEQNFDENREMDLSLSSQHISEVSPELCPENLHQRSMLDESVMKHMDEMQNQGNNHLHSHFQPPFHLEEYQHHIHKLTHGHLHDLREQHRLHDYEEPPQHQLFRDHHHMQDGVSDHVHHNSGRPLDGYWNMPLGLISKIKAESKEWYGDADDLLPESLGGPGGLKDDLYSNYRTPPHSNLGHDGMNGPRPPSMPPGGIPFSQAEQHYQHYGSHPGIRDMSPMSPGYPSHNRNPMAGSHPHSSQIPSSQQFGVQQHLQQGSQQHMSNQHLQQQYAGQQPYGGQPMGMQTHPGQQIPSPYHQTLVGHLGPGMGVHEGREGRERGDPYNFVDEYTGPPSRPVDEVLGQIPKRRGRKPKHIKLMENGGDPLAIAAAQAAHEAKKRKWRQIGPDGKVLPLMSRPRKKMDRFDGISEDELAKKTLPDHLAHNLDIVIISKFPFQIGINPGLFAAYKGHHYAGPGNHFWKCLYLSGLIPEPLSSDDDGQLLEHGIGFTNIVSRTTRGSAELTRKEIKEGGQLLLAKLQRYQPRVAVFNGKGIYEIFSGKKEFTFGRQPEKIEGTHTHVWVMPSSSARCAQLPRALDKVPFYTALRKFRDFLKGTLSELTEEEVTFITKKHLKLEAEKLDGPLLPEMSDAFLDDQLNETCESELDSDEISRSISQSLFNLTGITREQLENMDCPTIPIRKKRGRPKKTPEDPNAPPRPKARALPTDLLLCNGEDPPRKKRGRPKKILEDGTIAIPKRPGRKPKALKDVLSLGGHPGDNPQMSLSHLNGMMPPSGFNSAPGGPFSPHFGNGSLHPLSGPHTHPGVNSSVAPMNSLHGNNRVMPHSGGAPLPVSLGNSGLQPPMCSTPNNSNGPHTPLNAMPQRVITPKPYGQSPGYSPGPRSHSQLSQPFSQSAEKSDIPSVDDHDLGLSPPPVSPVMTQPDFEPPTNLPMSEGVMASDLSTRSHKDEMGRQHPPSVQNQFSNPSTPVDETTYKNYPYSKACSPYNTNLEPSPSYTQNVAHSPSYPASVSVSPTYASNNTQSPCHTMAQSPSYSQNVNNSPSFPPNVSHSPSYPIVSNQSPTYPKATSQSPSYHPTLSQSPSCSSITRSPSYPSSLTHSPSYPPNVTHSPSYRPQLPQSPSFLSNANQSPALVKPLPLIANSPHVVKGDVSSKSISGLESLVDQIPSLNESDSSVLQQASSANPCTTSVTPGPTNGPFSPLGASSSYQGFSGGNGSYPAHYNSPQSAHPYSPHFSSNNTNLSTNFSVSSLANSSITTSLSYTSGYEGECSTTTSSNNAPATTNASNNSFSVSSLTGDSPSSTPSMYNNHYSPVPLGPAHNYSDLMNSSILPPTPPMGSSFMGSSSLMNSTSSVPNSSIHSSMNMAGSQLPYPYPQYGESASNYSGHGPSFPYSPTGSGFHLPSRFPYPSPYSSGPYAQGYTQNAVLERIKQTGMGFGGF